VALIDVVTFFAAFSDAIFSVFSLAICRRAAFDGSPAFQGRERMSKMGFVAERRLIAGDLV